MRHDRNSLGPNVPGLARLYFLLRQNLSDREFLSKDGSKIIYLVDNDVVFRFVDPFSSASARYMRILENLHSDYEQNMPRELGNLLAASAYWTTNEVFRGRHKDSLLLSNAYRDTLINQASQLATRSISRRLESIDRGELSDFLKDVRGSLSSGKREKLIDLRRRAPAIALSVMFHDDDPLEKLASIIEPLSKGNQEFTSEANLHSIWSVHQAEEIERNLFRRRSYLIKNGFRTEDNLRDNISSDAQAILECILLNQVHEQNGIRFLFLTGDSGIHHFIDGVYRNNPPPGWPSFNFVRRPVQFSEFFSVAAHNDGTVLSYLRFVFGPFISLGSTVENALYNQMYYWFEKEESNRDEGWPGMSSPSKSFRTVALNEIEHSINRTRHSQLLLYTATLADTVRRKFAEQSYLSELSDLLFDKTVNSFLREGLEAYKESFAKLSPYILRNESKYAETISNAWKSILEAAQGEAASDPPRNRHRRRLPYFPHFSHKLANSLNAVTGGEGLGADVVLGELARLAVGDVEQINIFIAGYLNQWDKAVALSEIAVESREGNRREEWAEFSYLHAVSLRHVEEDQPAKLRKAEFSINQAIQFRPDEPRYVGELVALKLSRVYHKHHYNWSMPLNRELHAEVWDVLQHVVMLTDRINYINPHVVNRLRSQTHANQILYILFCKVYGLLEDSSFEDAHYLASTLEVSVDSLKQAIDRRGGLSHVSDYLEFVLRAGRALLGVCRNDFSKAEREVIEIDALKTRAKGLVSYDQRKITEFLSWYASLPK